MTEGDEDDQAERKLSLTGDVLRAMRLVEAGVHDPEGLSLAVDFAIASVEVPDTPDRWRVAGSQVALDLLCFALAQIEYMVDEFGVPAETLLPLIRSGAETVAKRLSQDDSGAET